MIEDDKKRFVRGLLAYLRREGKVAATMSTLVISRKEFHHGRAVAFHEASQYVRVITKAKQVKKSKRKVK